MARWFLTFKAIDPNKPDSRWNVGIPKWLYQIHQNNGNEKAIARILLVDEILGLGTVRLYKGWSRFGKDDCFVYEGRPDLDYKSLSIETPSPPNMVFLIFVLPDGTIDDWTWRPLTTSGEVDGIKGELIWSKNPNCCDF